MQPPNSLSSVRPLTRLSALFLLVLAAALTGPFMSSASASPSASCDRSQFPTTCTIVEPDVQHPMTTYPQVQLYAGQHVAILAGGCVQTGGHGKTWRRYVNPFEYFGSFTDNFHGTIWIDGTTFDDIVELRYLQGATLTVNETTPLRLGYIDDDYSDNGYWGRAGDDGPGDQCKGYSNAWVYLTIT